MILTCLISCGVMESRESSAKSVTTSNSRKHDELLFSVPPSHILQDGRFVFLPQPTHQNRIQFFERSIARCGLLKGYLEDSHEDQEDKVEEQKKVHPLALASARLQSNGVNELNRAINLNTLVSSDEYFGLSNVVDPSLDQTATGDSTVASNNRNEAKRPAEGAPQLEASQRLKSSLIWKTKIQQFQSSSRTLKRHKRQLMDAIVAQQQPDRRLRQLRSQWRLVAPEHGTRALPHATHPTEILAADVDVHGATTAALGRLAKRIPRFATVELHESFPLKYYTRRWAKLARIRLDETAENENTDDVGSKCLDDEEITKEDLPFWTTAEAFALADPTLGKLDADFDPQKVALLTVQVDIEKPSTGFCQNAHLAPMRTMSMSVSESTSGRDEKVLVDLQHSLFCAKLFESIRREVIPDTIELGQTQALPHQQSVWLSCESDQFFLTPPSMMSGGDGSRHTRLSVVHCHEGEVKVQLDSEYTLCVKLVEARDANNIPLSSPVALNNSGSQTADQLKVLCRTLLHHAQESYHLHSVQAVERRRKEEAEEKQTENLLLRKKKVFEEVPNILQSTVSLGGKILFEHRIRKTLIRVNQQIKLKRGLGLQIEWLPLYLFDLTAHFIVTFGDMVLDANLVGDELTVTHFVDENYRKTKFYSDSEFELFLLTMTTKYERIPETESSA